MQAVYLESAPIDSLTNRIPTIVIVFNGELQFFG